MCMEKKHFNNKKNDDRMSLVPKKSRAERTSHDLFLVINRFIFRTLPEFP